ncbi:MAG: DUF1318 domain-containing protein [Candidatus Omnitrophica bacterium]|nr:DUF1318 domain-containing protein [Candidatus Omnitrophota bacterium]
MKLPVLFFWVGMGVVGMGALSACRATVAGDPNRPIKIEAHITVDVRQVKEAAASIEDFVSGKSPAPAKPSSRWEGLVSPAYAESAELKYTTPEVQAALDSRRNRFEKLKTYKAQGLVGEDNQGHVASFGGDANVASLVEAENRDREVVYQAIVQQNNLAPAAIETVRSTFAQVQREKAELGEKIQQPSGEWVTQ